MTDSAKHEGLIPRLDRALYGSSSKYAAAATPKLKCYTPLGVTPNELTPDEALQPEAYRWFRRDELVRRCTIINASFATFASGFETELEAIEEFDSEEEETAFLEQFKYVKTYVDTINKQCNLDQALFVAQVKRAVYGKAGFEIVKDGKGVPSWLLSLRSINLFAQLNPDWSIKSYRYLDNQPEYQPEDIMFFTNLQLENDYVGVSDIEPIETVCSARHNLLKKDFPKITRRMWAPYTYLEADTLGMTDADEDTFLKNLSDHATAGESMAGNKSVKPTVVSMTIDFGGLVSLMDKLEETIIRAFGTPRFLLNKPIENRATAYVEFEAYIQGPIAAIQLYFQRELEGKWYTRLVKAALASKGYSGPVPVKVKHVWKAIRDADVYDMADCVAKLYSNGLGLLADYPEICFDMMGFDKTILEKKPFNQPQSDQPQIPTQIDDPSQPPNQPPSKLQAPRTETQIQNETVTPHDVKQMKPKP